LIISLGHRDASMSSIALYFSHPDFAEVDGFSINIADTYGVVIQEVCQLKQHIQFYEDYSTIKNSISSRFNLFSSSTHDKC